MILEKVEAGLKINPKNGEKKLPRPSLLEELL